MSDSRPLYLSMNGTSIKVARWQRAKGTLRVGTVIRGDQAAHDALAAIGNGSISVQWGDEPAQMAQVDGVDHRHAGSGPTATHRIDFTLELANTQQPVTKPDTPLEQQLADLRAEVAELRAEMARLRELVQGRQSPRSNLTLIETESFESGI